MNRKKLISVVVLILSITFILIVLGTRGSSLQSSLLGDATSSGSVMFNFSQDATLQELNVDGEKNLVYAMLLNSENGQGFYFPRSYGVVNGTKGLLAIAYKNKEFISFEQRISMDVRLPREGIRYVGLNTINFEGYTGVVTEDKEKALLHIELTSLASSPKVVDKILDPIFLLPVEVTFKDNADMHVQITNVTQTTFAGQNIGLPFFQLEGEIRQTNQVQIASTGSTLPTISKQVYTSTLSNPKNISYTSTAGLQYPNVPEIVAEQTQIQPTEIKEGEETPLFITVFVKDKDGIKDIDYVTVDLSLLGLAKNVKLLETSTTGEGKMYSTNFILPTQVTMSTAPYKIPYVAYDKENHTVKGVLELLVKKGKRPVELDLDGNGTVDIKDLTIYINAYQAATK